MNQGWTSARSGRAVNAGRLSVVVALLFASTAGSAFAQTAPSRRTVRDTDRAAGELIDSFFDSAAEGSRSTRPVKNALGHGQPGRCRFAAEVEGGERVFEMMSFPLDESPSGAPRVMNLYVDRTEATIDERRLVTTERLVSLGRYAMKGVARPQELYTLDVDQLALALPLPRGPDDGP